MELINKIIKKFKGVTEEIKPTFKDESCEYLICKIINYGGTNRGYKLTEVTPGLAFLLKRKYGGEYFEKNQTFIVNPQMKKGVKTISCTEENLQDMVIKIMKG